MKQVRNGRQRQERRLKVYPKYFERVNSWRPVIFPEIRLCGKWLQEMGFQYGQTIKVQQEMNKITITIESEDQLGERN